MPEMGSELATLGSAAAGRGQFRCRRRSVAVAKVGRWLAFCIKRLVIESVYDRGDARRFLDSLLVTGAVIDMLASPCFEWRCYLLSEQQ